MFKERLFALVGTLERIAGILAGAKVPFELTGGGAVMVHVNRVEPSAVRNTKDLDILINRADLERIKTAASEETKALNAVHLVFAGEKVRPNQAQPNPPLRPERISVHGVEVAVMPVADLVAMKLSSNRAIDQVHVQDLAAVGLITAWTIERAAPRYPPGSLGPRSCALQIEHVRLKT